MLGVGVLSWSAQLRKGDSCPSPIPAQGRGRMTPAPVPPVCTCPAVLAGWAPPTPPVSLCQGSRAMVLVPQIPLFSQGTRAIVLVSQISLLSQGTRAMVLVSQILFSPKEHESWSWLLRFSFLPRDTPLSPCPNRPCPWLAPLLSPQPRRWPSPPGTPCGPAGAGAPGTAGALTRLTDPVPPRRL